MADAFIKIYRKLIDWEWYDDPNTCRLFIHCLLKANWKPCKWRGIEIKPGQFITSLQSLASETHLTIQQVRTAISHLKSTGEITDEQHSNCRVITVNNWSQYQGDNRQSNKQITDEQQADNSQVTIDKEYKEREEGKEGKKVKHIYGEYKHVLLTDEERDKLMNEYGEQETSEAIKYLDEYIEMKGYKAKSHYLCIKKWVIDAVRKKKPTQGSTSVFDDWAKA